jgi:hypothetical protein
MDCECGRQPKALAENQEAGAHLAALAMDFQGLPL